MWIASSKAWRRMYWRHSGLVIRRYTASTRLLATRESAVEKKPRLRMTMRRSSSVRPSGFFHRAMSAVMLTSCGIQWLAQPSRYFCQAQSYLNGTSWLRSARQLIMRFSSTATRAEAPSSSARPSATSSLSRAALARTMAAESLAVTARASTAAAAPAPSRRSMLASVAWPALAPLITAAPVSSLSTSSQLSMEILLPGTRKINVFAGYKALKYCA
ncbi:hypothetical protein PFLuk1_03418 [Pseudomonas fluorescens]|nr:hypothetical protein PFLuk1_03418 [Pseudomonas fluorescens]